MRATLQPTTAENTAYCDAEDYWKQRAEKVEEQLIAYAARVGFLQAENARLRAGAEAFTHTTHDSELWVETDDSKLFRELRAWSALWKRAAKRLYSKYRGAIIDIRGADKMQERAEVRYWKELEKNAPAYMARQMASIILELKAENAKLRADVDSVTCVNNKLIDDNRKLRAVAEAARTADGCRRTGNQGVVCDVHADALRDALDALGK